MKNDRCSELSSEFRFFQELLLDILTRRVVFKKFEEEMKKTNLTEHNDVMSMVWYGYVVSQLSDCRKFFDRDGDAHCFRCVVQHADGSVLKERHKELYKIWKDRKLETVLNKYLLHADMRVSMIKTEVSASTMDLFIEKLETYLRDLQMNLTRNYLNIGSHIDDCYLLDREHEVDTFFTAVKKGGN